MSDKSYCKECRYELIYDEEQETGYCDLCRENAVEHEIEEQKHPDQRGG